MFLLEGKPALDHTTFARFRNIQAEGFFSRVSATAPFLCDRKLCFIDLIKIIIQLRQRIHQHGCFIFT